MLNLTARQKFILNTIIEKGSINTKNLSQQLDVSSRTISREILVINKELKNAKIAIKESNYNVHIVGNKEKLKNIKKSLGEIPLQWLLTQEQRLIVITAQLLTANEVYKSAYFSYKFNVVEGTISLYMDKIERWLNIHNLSLNRKRGCGILVEGPAWIKRNSFVELLYEYKPLDELLSFVYGTSDNPTIRILFKIVFGDKLISISKKLLQLINSEISNMDDIAYFSSFIHILLSLKNTKMGYPINLPQYLVQDLLLSNEFLFARKIKEFLDSLNIEITDDELAYIAIQITGNKYIYKLDRKFERLGISLEELSKEVVYEATHKLNINIEVDEQLIRGLYQHLSPALYRINMGINIKNTLVGQIKDYYGNLFDTVNYACKLVFSKYNITMSEDEIGFITMHIGAAIERSNVCGNNLSALVICPNGIGTAKILASKVKNNIAEIGNVTISSFKDWSQGDREYDLVLSTVNIEHGIDSNIITVSPFLRNEDIDKIKKFIKLKISKRNIFDNIKELSMDTEKENLKDNKYNMINDILKNLQLEAFNAESFKELVSLIVENISSMKLISDKEEVMRLIINREEMGSIVIPNCHVALLHTRSDIVKSPFVGVYRLKKSMKLKSVGFASENVDTFIVLLARRNEHSYILEQMGKISISLIENKSFTEILRIGDVKDLRDSLVKILNEEEN